jgi:hypothetical protein
MCNLTIIEVALEYVKRKCTKCLCLTLVDFLIRQTNTGFFILIRFNHATYYINMRIIAATLGLIGLLTIACLFSKRAEMKKTSIYNVSKLKQSMKIDGNWEKPQWQNIKAIDINNNLGDIPKFRPFVQAKMMYDDENIYVIFSVKDRYVHCVAHDFNGSIWEDSCVEFFFSPDTSLPGKYFNLEINCGGTPLMHYNIVPRKEYKILETEDIKKIEIAHSLPQKVDPEITEPVTWTIEYRIPIAILEKYSNITHPKHGIIWRANFYKIADKTSNPHYLTWSKIHAIQPDFHLPQFFGTLKFE